VPFDGSQRRVEVAGVSITQLFPGRRLNDVGHIALNGIHALGLTTAYLITPVGEPSTYVLMRRAGRHRCHLAIRTAPR